MITYTHRSFVQNICLVLLLLNAAFAGRVSIAGSLSISPVKITFSGGRMVEAISLRNVSAEAAVVQVETVAWTQQNGTDVYTPTKDLLATPPVFTIPAGATQIVRVGPRHPADPQREQAYRLFLQEVPPPQKVNATGLQLALRISVPVFVPPLQQSKPELTWRVTRVDADTLRVEASNAGNVHAHVAGLKVYRAGGNEPFAELGAFANVLAGQSYAWTFDAKTLPQPGEALRLAVTTDAGEIQADAVMPSP